MASHLDPKNMSESEVERLKTSEGFTAEPVKDGPSGFSVGYGTHTKAWPSLANKYNFPLTKEQAETMLRDVNKWNAKYMANKLGVERWNQLHQKQIDALLSMAYNTGAPGLWRCLGDDPKHSRFEAVGEKMETFATTGHRGKEKVNLTPRRQREAQLFREGSRRPVVAVGASASVSAGAEIRYSGDRGWHLANIGFGMGFEVVLTGPAAAVVGGAVLVGCAVAVGYGVYCVMTDGGKSRTDDTAESQAQDEKNDVAEIQEEDEEKIAEA